MPETTTTTIPEQQGTPAGGERTFTQAEVDALISREKAKATAKATKGMPSEEELAAYRTWRESQQTEAQRLASIQQERDTAQAALATAQAEAETLRQQMYVASKGLTGDEAEFVAYKAAKMVDDKTTFEQAVDQLVESRRKVKIDWSAPAGNSGTQNNHNQMMNDLIRGAFR